MRTPVPPPAPPLAEEPGPERVLAVGELVGLLTVGINHSSIYQRGHPRVAEAAHQLATALAKGASSTTTDGTFIGVVDGRLVSDGKPLIGPTLTAKRLIDVARRFRCGGFLLRPGLPEEELREFFALCGETKQPVASLEEARRLLASRGVHHVVLSPPYGEPGWLGHAIVIPGVGAVTTDDVAHIVTTSLPVYQSLLETVEGAHVHAESGREIDLAETRTRSETFVKAMSSRPADLFALTRYPTYDSYTINHSVRVALLVVLVAQRMGVPEDRLVEMATAGLLHDVGKGKIPHEILFKQGPLDRNEKHVMATHALLGRDILLQNRESSAMAIAAAAGHHLRHDRRGYPFGAPEWWRPSRTTFLMQVCDVFEALTAIRPYKPSIGPKRAYEIMLEDFSAFDPIAFREFVATIGLYPPGWHVRLTTGEEAIVLRTSSHIARPVVEIVADAEGRPIAPADRTEVDLSVSPRDCSVLDIVPSEEAVVDADPADYENRRTTLLYQCGHDGTGVTCEFCAA